MTDTVPSLVSTIIPVYNRAGMVGTAVDSVLAQTFRPIEIILVDDGSTDGITPALLDQLAAEQPDVIRVIHRQNGGAGLARESGRQAARGEFIQYLDSDDWLLSRKFEVQVKALESNPECDIAYGITRLVNQAGETLAEPSKHTGERHERLFPLLLIDRWWHTATPLYRRSLSDAAGPWPRRRPEDWDLEARMGALGTRLTFCDAVVSCHRDHDSPQRVSRGDQLEYLRDEAWFLPRLYRCARQAGITSDAAEMEHLSRWAFMRARYLGMLGKSDLARQLMNLAVDAAGQESISMRTVNFLASAIGWKATGRIAFWYDLLKSQTKA
jgi:glycosyltransferase involved in cell wall biosynthesis